MVLPLSGVVASGARTGRKTAPGVGVDSHACFTVMLQDVTGWHVFEVMCDLEMWADSARRNILYHDTLLRDVVECCLGSMSVLVWSEACVGPVGLRHAFPVLLEHSCICYGLH